MYSTRAYTLYCVCKTTKLGVYRLKFGLEQNPGKKDSYSLLNVVAVLPGMNRKYFLFNKKICFL